MSLSITAVESDSEFITSEDKDSLRLKEHGAVKIVRARDFLPMGRGRFFSVGWLAPPRSSGMLLD